VTFVNVGVVEVYIITLTILTHLDIYSRTVHTYHHSHSIRELAKTQNVATPFRKEPRS
jgi:hypothetical protein